MHIKMPNYVKIKILAYDQSDKRIIFYSHKQ